MHDPLVSIIIPCWNAEAYVGDAIESALGQTYPNVEVIVVDDGSTDGSFEIIKSFGSRIRYETRTNAGACAARNRGVAIANGELIQFLDSDDLLRPNKLEEQVALSAEFPREMVYCDWETIDGNAPVRKVHSYERDGLDPVLYALRYQIQTSTPLHWKEALRRVGGFRESLPCAQERDLHIRLACSGVRFHHLPKVLCTIRRRRDSVSDNWVRVLDQHLDTAFIARRMLQERGELTEARSIALAGFLARDARSYLRHREWSKARRYFLAARQLHSSGGLDVAYDSMTRLLRRCFGTRVTEYLVSLRRRLLPRQGIRI